MATKSDKKAWDAAQEEALMILCEAPSDEVERLIRDISKVLAGAKIAAAMMALCTHLVSILPGGDVGHRMNAIMAVLHRLLKARLTQNRPDDTLH